MSADAGIVPVGDEDRAVRRDADIRRPEPVVASSEEQILRVGLVAGSRFACRVSANDVRSGVAVDRVVLERSRQHVAFVNEDAGRRALARLNKIRDHSRIVKMPVLKWDFRLQIRSRSFPAGSGEFVLVAVIAKLHHEVDPRPAVAVVVVVRLPQRAE